MVHKHEPEFDASKPALVLLYGDCGKKHRLLDRDVIVIGRARGCDFGLEAPDISSIHCIIHRDAAGFHVRDCQSRAGTKLNGNAMREAPLRDGDLLQIGPFSFRANLPGGPTAGQAAIANARAEHVQRSRRNLARIALRHRKLLRLQGVLDLTNSGGKASKGQLNKQLSALKARVRDYDLRVRTLEDAERDLAKDREKLNEEMTAFRLEVQQAEQEKAGKRQEAHAEIIKEQETQSHQIDQRQRDLEALARQLEFREQQLQGRLDPLDAQQRQIQELRGELAGREQTLTQKLQALAREQKEFLMTRDQWARDQSSILTRVGQQKSALAQAEETLRQQRRDLDDLLANLEEGQAVSERQEATELLALRAENEALKQELGQRSEPSGPTQDEFLMLQLQNEEFKAMLLAMEEQRNQAEAAPATDASEEITALRKQLEEKDALLEEMQSKTPSEPIRDIDSYESELNEFRRQLEADRKKLTREMEQMRARNKELDEATRELELEMSKERAEMARERQRLDRMREDMRQDAERNQRESGLRDRLAPMQNLREHINRR